MKLGLGVLVVGVLFVACDGGGDSDKVAVPGRGEAQKSAGSIRGSRRAFPGAPPVVPHPLSGEAGFNAKCESCHNEHGMAVEGYGFAPPTPHGLTPGMGQARCEQCHVERVTTGLFVENTLEPWEPEVLRGSRMFEGAPPVMPHRLFMRENCAACHSGPAAREEIRTSHPERANCLQCHVEQRAALAFVR